MGKRVKSNLHINLGVRSAAQQDGMKNFSAALSNTKKVMIVWGVLQKRHEENAAWYRR